MIKKLSLILSCLSIALVSSFPENLEVKYDYHGKILVEFESKVKTISQYEIFAEIHAYSSINGTIMFLKNISHSLYIGPEEFESRSVKKILSPKESYFLELPFYIPREQTANETQVLMHENDKEWSAQIKRAIIVLFDFKLTKRSPNSKYMSSVIEDHDFNNYQIISLSTDTEDEVIKQKTTKTNIISEELKLSQDLSQTVRTIQSLKLLSKIENRIGIPVNLSKFHIINKFDSESANYKYSSENDTSSKTIIQMLESIFDYIEYMKIDFKESINTNRNITVLKNTFENMNISSILGVFEELQALKSDKQQYMIKIFFDILPHVNTNSSIMTILDLIFNRNVDDATARKMLNTITYRFKHYDGQIVEKLFDLMETTDHGDFSEDLKMAAFLAASAMLKQGKSYFDSTGIDQKNRLKTTLMFIFNITGNPLLVLPLSNIHDSYPLLNDNFPQITTLAMLPALSDIDVLDEKSEQFYKSLVMDKTKEFKVREMALYILAYKSWSDHFFDFVQSVSDDELCNSLYNIMKKISDGKYVHHNKEKADEFLTKSNSCVSKKLSFYGYFQLIFDAIDNLTPDYELETLGDFLKHGYFSFYLSSSNTGNASSQKSIYIDIKLRRPEFFKRPTDYFKYFYLWNELIHVDFVVMHDKIPIYAESFAPPDSLKTLSDLLRDYLKHSRFFVDFPVDSHKKIMTNFGFPVSIYNTESSVRFMQDNFTEITPKLLEEISADVKGWVRFECGIKFYNPMIDAWQGLRLVNNFQYRANLSAEVIAFFAIGLLTKTIPEDNDFVGFQLVRHDELFMDQNKKSELLLKESCPTCEDNYINGDFIFRTKQHRNDFTVWEYDSPHTGQLYRINFFDCEDIALGKYKDMISNTISSKINTNNVGLNKFYDLWKQLKYFSGLGMCGVGARVERSKNFPTTHLACMYNPYQSRSADYDYSILCGTQIINSDKLINQFMLNLTMNYNNRTNFDAKLKLKYSNNSALFATFERNFNDFKLEDKINYYEGFHNESDDAFYEYTKFDIRSNGSFSEKQIFNFDDEIKQYETCSVDPKYSFDDCISYLTALKNYDVNVKFENANSTFYKWVLKQLYQNGKNTSGSFDFNFKFTTNEMDISTVNIHKNETVEKVTLDSMKLLQPYSVFEYENININWYCEIGIDHLQLPMYTHAKQIDLPNRWTLIGEFCGRHCKESLNISLKKTQDDRNTLVLRLMKGNDTMIFDENDILNESVTNFNESLKYNARFNMEYIFLPSLQKIIIHLISEFVNIEFDGKIAKFSFLPTDNMNGLCLGK